MNKIIKIMILPRKYGKSDELQQLIEKLKKSNPTIKICTVKDTIPSNEYFNYFEEDEY